MITEPGKHRWPYVLAGALIVLAAAATFLYPRFARCVVYGKLISLPGARENLAPRPTDVDISYAGAATPLSTGYAEAALPPDWATSITLMNGAICVVGREEETVVFMRPFFSSEFSEDGNYTFEVESARTEDVPLFDVFTMSSSEFKRLMYHTLPKAMNSFNQNGIGLFETEDVRGMIRYGASDKPGEINVEVWSKPGEVSQGILIFASTAERAMQLVQCILSNLDYSIDYLPPSGELDELIHDAIEPHELYTSDPDRQGEP